MRRKKKNARQTFAEVNFVEPPEKENNIGKTLKDPSSKNVLDERSSKKEISVTQNSLPLKRRKIDFGTVVSNQKITKDTINLINEDLLQKMKLNYPSSFISSSSSIPRKSTNKLLLEEEMKKKEILERKYENESLFGMKMKERILHEEIKKLEKEFSFHKEKEFLLHLTVKRLQDEIKINEELYEKEKVMSDTILKVSEIVEEKMKKQKKVTSFNNSENVIKLNSKIQKLTVKLSEILKKIHQKEDQQRKIRIENQNRTLEKHLTLEKSWIEKLKLIEHLSEEYHKKIQRILSNKVEMNEELQGKQKRFIKQGKHVRKVLVQLIQKINGRDSGLSVAKSIRLYSELKKGLEEGIFSMQFLQSFLEKHQELGITLDIQQTE